jgi:very-short-patch-repair endonuclease
VGVKLQSLDTFAGRHHGLITRERAEALGVGRSSWYRALDSGHFEQLYPNVARLWGSPSTFEQRTLAAVWAAGTGALASHRSAASLWGVQRPDDDPVDVMHPRRSRYSMPSGVVVHRPRDVLDLRPLMRFAVPVTDPMRMLLDLGAVDEAGVYPALITVLSSKVASPKAIRGALARHARKGRHGVTALRNAIEQWLSEELPPDSELEALMAALVARHHLPPVAFHAVVEGFEVDFLVVGTPVIIECDGWASHGLDRDQFEYDRIRNTELTAAGYVFAHVTWRQLQADPAAAAARIVAVIRRWSPDALARVAG